MRLLLRLKAFAGSLTLVDAGIALAVLGIAWVRGWQQPDWVALPPMAFLFTLAVVLLAKRLERDP